MMTWNKARAAREARLQAGSRIAKGKVVQAADATALRGTRRANGAVEGEVVDMAPAHGGMAHAGTRR